MIGYSIDDRFGLGNEVANTGYTLAELMGNANAINHNAARNVQRGIQEGIFRHGGKVGLKGGALARAGNLAGGGKALTALRIAQPLAAVGGVLGAADVIAGNDSFANKAMDTAAMGIGGFLGSVGGPMGIAAGAGIGKTASDGLQWLFGDKKTAEQRKMEEALALLKAGVI